MRNFYAQLANSTIQLDVQHITDNCCFRKKKKLSYAELLQEGKQISSLKIESVIDVIDLAAIRSALIMDGNCSSDKFQTFPTVRDSDSSMLSNSSSLVFIRKNLLILNTRKW